MNIAEYIKSYPRAKRKKTRLHRNCKGESFFLAFDEEFNLDPVRLT